MTNNATLRPTALVTGSAGFIGRHTVRTLRDAGYDVTGVDIDPDGDPDTHQLDARSVFNQYAGPGLDMLSALDDPFDVVVHCAARIGGRLGIENSAAQLAAVNLELDAGLWRYVLATRPGHVVYWSSSAAYPVGLQARGGHMPRRLPELLDEVDLIDGEVDTMLGLVGPAATADGTYGEVKRAGERMAAQVRAAGIPITVFRPFSGYGTDQSTDYPFAAFIKRALEGSGRSAAAAFTVWGDGEQARDFVHILDIMGALVAALERPYHGTVNICTGRRTSFNELARLVLAAEAQLTGRPAAGPYLLHRHEAPVGVHNRVGNPAKLHQLYRPRVTLEAGIAAALAGTMLAADLDDDHPHDNHPTPADYEVQQ